MTRQTLAKILRQWLGLSDADRDELLADLLCAAWPTRTGQCN